MTSHDNLVRILKRRIATAREMNKLSWEKFLVGSKIADLEKWLIAEGWTLEEWKQSERDKKKGLL